MEDCSYDKGIVIHNLTKLEKATDLLINDIEKEIQIAISCMNSDDYWEEDGRGVPGTFNGLIEDIERLYKLKNRLEMLLEFQEEKYNDEERIMSFQMIDKRQKDKY